MISKHKLSFEGISDKVWKNLDKKLQIDVSKYKICIYGSEKVVEKLNAFERLDINLEENLCKQRFIELCNEMRKDSNSKELNSKSFEEAIYGSR